jgi:uncharacterized membrane protein
MPNAKRATTRLQYLDWMRGLAVVLMIETHVFDSFLAEKYRTSEWYWLSQFLGGMPAPMFLFLLGISLALVLDRLHEKEAPQRVIIEKVLRRSGWILLLAYAFRVEQAAEWFPYSDWRQIFKVDILNCLALSSLAVGCCGMAIRRRRMNALLMGILATITVVATPWVFLIHQGLARPLLEYLNGGGHPNYFMFFSWGAFALAGAATGYLLVEARSQGTEERFMQKAAIAGVASYAAGFIGGWYPDLVYGFFDYSLTSPQFFFVRLGYMLILLYLAYRWSTRSSATRWSPFLIFGQTSLLIYWIHIEFVYGRLRFFRNNLNIVATAAQLLWLIPLMFLLAFVRLNWRRWKPNSRSAVPA